MEHGRLRQVLFFDGFNPPSLISGRKIRCMQDFQVPAQVILVIEDLESLIAISAAGTRVWPRIWIIFMSSWLFQEVHGGNPSEGPASAQISLAPPIPKFTPAFCSSLRYLRHCHLL
jgi:hypothetical protein